MSHIWSHCKIDNIHTPELNCHCAFIRHMAKNKCYYHGTECVQKQQYHGTVLWDKSRAKCRTQILPDQNKWFSVSPLQMHQQPSHSGMAIHKPFILAALIGVWGVWGSWVHRERKWLQLTDWAMIAALWGCVCGASSWRNKVGMLRGSCDFVLTQLVKQDVMCWDGLISNLTGTGPVCSADCGARWGSAVLLPIMTSEYMRPDTPP